MKKIHWSILSETGVEADANRVSIKNELKCDLVVSVIRNDNKNDKIFRYTDILKEHKVLLTPRFQWELSNYQDTDLSNIEYFIKKNDDCWVINKEERQITVKPGKEAEFEKAKKEIHKKLLKDKFADKIGSSSKFEVDASDMKYAIIEDGEGYKVKIYRGDKSEDHEFPWEQVEIEPSYWQNKEVDFDNLNNVVYQKEEKKSPRTTGWIIFFVVLTAVLMLIIIFWKKIWKWIKGEREQEKKVKEQLDIF